LKKIFELIETYLAPKKIQRLGKPGIKPRPLKVILPTMHDVFKILGNFHKLRNDSTFKDVRCASDKT